MKCSLFFLAATVLGALFIVGCANVVIKPVPSRADYIGLIDKAGNPYKWTVDDQRAADAIQGWRIPAVRQYVVVNKEFLRDDAESNVVSGKLGLDGRLVQLDGASFAWGAKLKDVPLPSEVYVSRNSALATPNESVPVRESKTVTAPAAPGPVKLLVKADALTVSDQSLNHMGDPGSAFSVTLKVNKSTLGTDSNQLGAVRGFYLLRVKGQKSGDTPADSDLYLLPLSLYVPATDGTATLGMKNALLPGIKSGSYVFAIRYFKLEGDVMHEYLACTSLENTQLSVGTDWSNAAITALGRPDLTTVNVGTNVLSGLVHTKSPPIIGGPHSRIELSFTITPSNLTRSDGTNFLTPSTLDKTGTVTAMGLVPADPNNPSQPVIAEAVRLPFTAGQSKTLPSTVDFIGAVDYASSNSKPLHQGSYFLAAWVTTEDAGTSKTSLVLSTSTDVHVDDNSVKLPDPPTVPGATSPVTTSTTANPTTAVSPKTSTPDPATNTPQNPTAPGSEDADGGTHLPGGHATFSGTNDEKSEFVVPVNEYFTIVHMQDHDHLIAVQPKARLGDVAVDFSRKYGWLTDHINIRVDNKSIADFIFKQIDKATSLAVDLVKLRNGSPAPLGSSTTPTTSTTDSSIPSAQSKRLSPDSVEARAALFKVHIRKWVVPGLYPVLTLGEMLALDNEATVRRRLANGDPMINFHTRDELVIELISFAPRSNGTAPGGNPTPQTPRNNPPQVKVLLERAKQVASDPKFKDIIVTNAQNNLDDDEIFAKTTAGTAVDPEVKTDFAKAINADARTNGWATRTIKVSDDKNIKK